MKQPFLLIILFLLGSFKEPEQKQYVRSELNGSIKKIIETSSYAYLDNGIYKPLSPDELHGMEKVKSYNRKGELKELKLFFEDQLLSTVKIKYNSKGQISLQQHYDRNGQLTTTVERTSDSTTITTDQRGFGTVQTTEEILSPEVKREISQNFDQGLTTISTVTRDNKDWIIQANEIVILRGDTTVNGTEYYKYTEIDQNGNWVKCLISTSTQFDSVQVKAREIEYY